jgi:hypothetical protein
MPDLNVWTCPGCGAVVAMPPDVHVTASHGDERRLDQLAQALCGCWVVSLSNGRVSRLLGAIMAGDEGREDPQRRTAAGAG